MAIPYREIATGLALIVGIWAFLVAENAGGRIFIIAVQCAIFFLPGAVAPPDRFSAVFHRLNHVCPGMYHLYPVADRQDQLGDVRQ